MTQPVLIVFPLYPGVTHLDFTGPHQFFARVPGVTIETASVGGRPIAADGLTFSELTPLESLSRCDVLCVPGGFGCGEAMLDPAYLGAIRRLGGTARYLTSVCSGSLLLAAAGFLRGKRAACHWAWRDQLPLFGAIPDAGRVVRDGTIVTGGGVTAGIDFALTLIAELRGEATAKLIQLGLEYAPAPPFGNVGTPDTADPEIVATYRAQFETGMAQRRTRIAEAARAVAPHEP